ncbi:MAG: pyridoxamine 5'-phosphate oxidase [Bacteroidota bacterium]
MISPSNPYHLFAEVFAAARDTGMVEPNAMALATADADGCPTVRMVLLKDFDDDGFVFYTNLESRKSRQIQENPNAAICFYWQQIGRQVRAEGSVEPVSDAEADAYFASRAHGSQIGAWSSKQSETLPDREELLERVRATEERFAGAEVPRPPFWSGFRIRPRRIEFWTAGESRLHDRLVYEKEEGTDWRVRRLYP